MAAKRPSTLDALKLAASTKPGTAPKAKATAPTSGSLTTAIHIRREHWDLLRRVAFARAQASGGRASVSAVIGDLVEANRGKLERDAG